MNIIYELKWRKFLYNKTKNIKNILYKNFIIYIGFDPTNKYLHLGHIIPFFLFKIFLNYYKNIKFIIIIGEYTTKINNIINNNKIIINIKFLKKQIINIYKKIVNKNLKNLIILNNNKWLKKISLINFINKILKFINIKYLIYKKKKKIKKNINFKKIIYPIIQSYDYLYLYKKYKCNFQIGGSDQWKNIILGTKFIKKILKKKVYGLTFSLLTDNKNIKFSKSNKKFNIWLNKNKNTSYNIYQFFINLKDKISINFIKYFSILNIKNIKYIIYLHKNFKNKYIQKILSKIIINLIYSNKKYKYAKYLSKYLFNKNNKFLLLNNYKKYIYNNIQIINIYKYIFFKKKIIKILSNKINISQKKIKYFFKKKYIKFNYQHYFKFIKRIYYLKYKYIICNINKLFFLIKII
ncbi:MAG: tyrosine--tRNA ligase [Candidatus Shikimatogenerans sp. Tcar]|uniref:Tyrosine--tRNA ligase n=1 Tax=Candidatus Shikimatogenerans sp. Tcar TaxID=3158565 RepID=A0AAU7QSB1_9FLAO